MCVHCPHLQGHEAFSTKKNVVRKFLRKIFPRKKIPPPQEALVCFFPPQKSI